MAIKLYPNPPTHVTFSPDINREFPKKKRKPINIVKKKKEIKERKIKKEKNNK